MNIRVHTLSSAMRSFGLLSLLLLAAAADPAFAMDKKQILELAGKPHSRENLLPELKIFPEGREFKVEMTLYNKGEDPRDIENRIIEKVVEGRYLVSSWRFPGAGSDTVMVITFDPMADVYRKWTLLALPDGSERLDKAIGATIEGSRAISWANAETATVRVLTLEHYQDTRMSWTVIYLTPAGDVLRRGVGVSNKIN